MERDAIIVRHLIRDLAAPNASSNKTHNFET
jgi:hypothetical protein